MGTEFCKQTGFMYDIFDPPSDPGGIIEHKKWRDTAYVFKYISESLTDTFRSFTAKDLYKTVIAVWE